MVKSVNIGMPRIGSECQLANAVKDFVNKKVNQDTLQQIAKDVRKENIKAQIDCGIDIIPCNDLSFFDQVLDTTVLLGNVPRKYYWEGGMVSMDIYFTMITGQQREKFDVTPTNLARWFNTNYLYSVPEFSDPVEFVYSDNKHVISYLEAKQSFNIKARPVFLGPMSYLLMGKVDAEDVNYINKLNLIDDLIPVYKELFINCKRLGITDVQFEEPMLTSDLTKEEQNAYRELYTKLSTELNGIKIHLITSCGELGNNLECAMSLPFDSIHINLIKEYQNIDTILDLLPSNTSLSLGVVDAESVWINDLNKSITMAQKVIDKIGSERVLIGPTSSLFLCPFDIKKEKNLPEELQNILSFTIQKLNEIKIITDVLNNKDRSIELEENKKYIEKLSALSKNFATDAMIKFSSISGKDFKRPSVFKERIKEQNRAIFDDKMPLMPITCNGSIPFFTENDEQSAKELVKFQTDLEFDIISDSESYANSNAEFLANNLDGVFIPEFGFTQHYGYFYRKPHIIYKAPKAKSNTYQPIAEKLIKISDKPIKITVCGAVNFTNQSCLLPDIPYIHAASLVSDIIKNEIKSLEETGIKIICIDEESFLQLIPLRNDHVSNAISSIVDIFKYVSCDIKNTTQLHTRVLHANFDEFLEDLARLDSDVLLIGTNRLHIDIFESFISYRYPNHISLGVYDSWSERIPLLQEISLLLKRFARSLDEGQIWISPDFGFTANSKDRFVKVMEVVRQAVKDFRDNHS